MKLKAVKKVLLPMNRITSGRAYLTVLRKARREARREAKRCEASRGKA